VLSVNPNPRPHGVVGSSISHCYPGSERGRLPRTLDFKRYPFSFYYLPSSSVHRASRTSMLESRSRAQDSMTDLLFIGHKLGNKIVGFFFVELEGLPIVIERKDPS